MREVRQPDHVTREVTLWQSFEHNLPPGQMGHVVFHLQQVLHRTLVEQSTGRFSAEIPLRLIQPVSYRVPIIEERIDVRSDAKNGAQAIIRVSMSYRLSSVVDFPDVRTIFEAQQHRRFLLTEAPLLHNFLEENDLSGCLWPLGSNPRVDFRENFRCGSDRTTSWCDVHDDALWTSAPFGVQKVLQK